MNDSFIEELLPDFILESREHLEAVEPGLLDLEEHLGEACADTVNEVFRAIHSLKGAASFFGFDNLTSLAHVMENLLMLARDGEIQLDRNMVDLLISGTDKLRLMVEDLQHSDRVDVTPEVTALKQYLESERTTAPPPTTGQSADSTEPVASAPIQETPTQEDTDVARLVERGQHLYSVNYSLARHIFGQQKSVAETNDLLASIGQVLDCDQDLDNLPEADDPRAAETNLTFLIATVLQSDYLCEGLGLTPGQIEEHSVDQMQLLLHQFSENRIGAALDSVTAPVGGSQAPNSDGAATEIVETLRVPVTVLNKLMDLAGELVLSRNQLKQQTDRLAGSGTGLTLLTQNIDLVTSELQATIMDARLQPIGVLFNKFPRIIRDLGRQLGKEVDLLAEGQEVDMDKSIIELLSDPLTHLVRNSADHGLETPAERKLAGKPERGSVKLTAYHKNGQVCIDIADDGRGIDPDMIRAKVLDKQLMTAEQMKSMSQPEICRLVFLPGFSTATEVSEVSGRGVGMDVVKTNIERLGGTIVLNSELGRGTTVTLKLPLTLAIIPAQIVDLSGVRYAIPQANLEEMVQTGTADDKCRIERFNGKEILRLRGELLPLVNLDNLLHRHDVGVDDASLNEMRRNILVLSAGGSRFGLSVSELLDGEEIVVKPLSRYVKACAYYAGATILGDGKVAMILDVAGLADTARLDLTRAGEDARHDHDTREESTQAGEASFLMMESAPGEYFAVPLDCVSRVDKIPRADLIEMDDQTFFEYQGALIRMISLGEYLPGCSVDREAEYLHIMVPRLVPHPIGIAAIAIHDVVKSGAELNFDDHRNEGVVGSALIDGRPTLFVDLYGLYAQAAPHLYQNDDRQLEQLDLSSLLIAESNPVHLALLRRYFNRAARPPLFADNGLDAFRQIQAGQVQMVLASSQLSSMDGAALLAQAETEGSAVTFVTLVDRPASETSGQVDERFERKVVKFAKPALLQLASQLIPTTEEAPV